MRSEELMRLIYNNLGWEGGSKIRERKSIALQPNFLRQLGGIDPRSQEQIPD